MNLNQVTVPVSDVERSIVFYERLGLKLIVRELPDYARFECPDGDSTFSVHQVKSKQSESGVWIYFEVEDLDNYVQHLANKGVEFEELPTDKSWLWRESRLKDLDSNQVIIYSAGNNRKNPPWRTN
ncbi:MAG TPA: VOC family protein [Chitinophagaceae bacterium]|jgi:catechol 2,3-dioxygenase-like lactoylglutathione lyase family enzyme|nr:VOC family protein [Chitinophagaceae bacterium]